MVLKQKYSIGTKYRISDCKITIYYIIKEIQV